MAKSLSEARRQLSEAEFDLTLHAVRRLVQRNISELDIRQAGATAVAIQEYMDDKFSPSCLLLGFTDDGRPLHILVSLAETTLLRLVTVYEPDPVYWINHSTRR